MIVCRIRTNVDQETSKLIEVFKNLTGVSYEVALQHIARMLVIEEAILDTSISNESITKLKNSQYFNIISTKRCFAW